MRHEIAFKRRRVHSPLPHFFNLLRVIMNSLPAGRNLKPAEQEVKAFGYLGIRRCILRIKRSFGGSIVRNKNKLTAGLFRHNLTKKPLLLRLKIFRIRNCAVKGFGHELFCFRKRNYGDFLACL